MKHRLANFLIKYHSTFHSVTGRTSAELMVKRQLRTRLTLLKPNLAQVVESKQMKQKFHHDRSQVERTFKVNEPVRVRNPVCGFLSQGLWSGVQASYWRCVEVVGIPFKWAIGQDMFTQITSLRHLVMGRQLIQAIPWNQKIICEVHKTSSKHELCTRDAQDDRPEPETDNTEITGGLPTQEQENTEPARGSLIPTEGLTLRRSPRMRKPVEKLNLWGKLSFKKKTLVRTWKKLFFQFVFYFLAGK